MQDDIMKKLLSKRLVTLMREALVAYGEAESRDLVMLAMQVAFVKKDTSVEKEIKHFLDAIRNGVQYVPLQLATAQAILTRPNKSKYTVDWEGLNLRGRDWCIQQGRSRDVVYYEGDIDLRVKPDGAIGVDVVALLDQAVGTSIVINCIAWNIMNPKQPLHLTAYTKLTEVGLLELLEV